MREYIFRLQYELSLDPRHRITKDETDTINEILLRFRQEAIQKYFSGAYERIGFSFEVGLKDFLETHQEKHEFRNNITYLKLYYILQLYYLKLHNIVDDNKLGVIQANATKETIDNLLSK
jgi:hypothetical protein